MPTATNQHNAGRRRRSWVYDAASFRRLGAECGDADRRERKLAELVLTAFHDPPSAVPDAVVLTLASGRLCCVRRRRRCWRDGERGRALHVDDVAAVNNRNDDGISARAGRDEDWRRAGAMPQPRPTAIAPTKRLAIRHLRIAMVDGDIDDRGRTDRAIPFTMSRPVES